MIRPVVAPSPAITGTVSDPSAVCPIMALCAESAIRSVSLRTGGHVSACPTLTNTSSAGHSSTRRLSLFWISKTFASTYSAAFPATTTVASSPLCSHPSELLPFNSLDFECPRADIPRYAVWHLHPISLPHQRFATHDGKVSFGTRIAFLQGGAEQKAPVSCCRFSSGMSTGRCH